MTDHQNHCDRVLESGVRSAEECLLQFAIRDTGIGIAPEAQARIFESFSQADSSTTCKYGGTGLGLAIAKQLVQLMGGEIGVESELRKGSTFWFTARLEKQSAAPADQIRHSEVQGWQVFGRAKPRARFRAQVLLAEDNLVNQEVTRAMLESGGCQVTVVSNGHEVLTTLSRAAYGLVLLDCQMPVLDGFAATRALREREAAVRPTPNSQSPTHIPIIALTAHAMRGDRELCLNAGMDDYLSKPFTQEQLWAVLHRWLPEEPSGGNRDRAARSVWTPRTTRPAPLDPEALDHLRALQQGSAGDIFGKVVQSYLNTAPQLLQSIREAVARNDAAALRKAAHTLKSSSASLGALALAALCKGLEALGRTNRLTEAATVLPALLTEGEAVRVALAAEINGSGQ